MYGRLLGLTLPVEYSLLSIADHRIRGHHPPLVSTHFWGES
jgi:hypothetical protein